MPKTLPPQIPALLALLMALASPFAALDAAAQPARAAPAAGTAERQGQRLALVIGNGAYREGALANPVNDARAMAQVLRDSGFTVMLHTDLDHRRMMQVVRDFGNELRKGGVGLFYFAGHGVQIRGRNYLVPIGADIQREDEVAYAALDAQAVLDKMESAGNGTNLLILDACRNNPFARSFRSSSSGLAQMEAPVGTLVAFATAPGTVASDGQGSNGLYTQNLLEAMRKPGLKVEDVFKQVRVAVRRDSGGKQVPWESTSLEGDLYFRAPAAPVAAAAPAPAARPQPAPQGAATAAAAPDELLWSAIEAGSDPAELRAFLRRYPDSRRAEEARRRLALARPAAGATTAAPAPAAAAATAGERPTPAVAFPEPPPRLALAQPALSAPPAGRPDTTSSKPSPNAQGYRVGDTWNFQVVDLWRGEVVRNHTLRIARIGPAGELYTPAGSRIDAWGRLQRIDDVKGDRVRDYAPFLPRGWEDWQPGSSRPATFTESMATRSGTPLWRCEHEGTLRQVRTERVKVPAGEFMARRIEIDARCQRQAPGETNSLHNWRHVIWYVPELRYYVAMEIEWRSANGQLERREREELTSHELRGTDVASR